MSAMQRLNLLLRVSMEIGVVTALAYWGGRTRRVKRDLDRTMSRPV